MRLGCPLVSAPWRLALSVWSLRLLLAHRSHHPRACRVTREALSAQQISSFGENWTRELGEERERGRPRESQDACQKGGRPAGPSGVQLPTGMTWYEERLLCWSLSHLMSP